MTLAIGLIGVGRMGMPVCANLIAAGFTVLAFDRRPEVEPQARALGAAWGKDSIAVAEAADVLVTILPGTSELEDAMRLATPSLRAGNAWIDMTSCAPGIGLALHAAARERGIECLEATLGGGVEAAQQGRLQLFVGGAADAVERHRPLLEALGEIDHVGASGAGYKTKLLVNLLWFGQAVAVGEAMLLARRSELDLDRLRGVLGRSTAASEFIRRDVPALLDGDYLRSFGLERCCEELDAVVALAEQEGVPFSLSTQVRDTYRRALERFGEVDGELLAVAMLEDQAGMRLRRD